MRFLSSDGSIKSGGNIPVAHVNVKLRQSTHPTVHRLVSINNSDSTPICQCELSTTKPFAETDENQAPASVEKQQNGGDFQASLGR